MFGPDSALVTGWRDDPDGGLRLALAGDPGLHTHVVPGFRAEVLRQLGPAHNVIPALPREALCTCSGPAAPEEHPMLERRFRATPLYPGSFVSEPGVPIEVDNPGTEHVVSAVARATAGQRSQPFGVEVEEAWWRRWSDGWGNVRWEIDSGELEPRQPAPRTHRIYFGAEYSLDAVRELHAQEGGLDTLIANAEGNGWPRLVRTVRGNWQPLQERDVVVDLGDRDRAPAAPLRFYVTFGRCSYAREPHPSGLPLHPDGYLTIGGVPDEPTARALVVEAIGTAWSGLYEEDPAEQRRFYPLGSLGRIVRDETGRAVVELEEQR